jgi:copper chaperone NosL
MTQRVHLVTRVLLALAVLSLAAGYYFPLWQIQLWAPQYPEGLNMKMWIDRLSGEYEIISGLNHYIGMRLIKPEMFPEFGYAKYLLGAVIAVGAIAVLIGRRWALWMYVTVLALGGLAGLVDFYVWGYDYGHNLSPHAPIQVPGMSYQPPLIGYKALLNFTAYSGPETGGFILITSGALSALLLGWEQFLRNRGRGASARNPSASPAAGVAMLFLAMSTTGCEARPQPIRYGQDECADCKMMISDQRFGAEIVTRKGRVVKFDDVGCMQSFLARGAVSRDEIRSSVVSDFNQPNHFLALDAAFFLKNDALKSPMRSDTAAFATEAEMQKVKERLGGGQHGRWADVASGR